MKGFSTPGKWYSISSNVHSLPNIMSISFSVSPGLCLVVTLMRYGWTDAKKSSLPPLASGDITLSAPALYNLWTFELLLALATIHVSSVTSLMLNAI